MDELKSRLLTLNKNLNLLREREAKYGGSAPLELVNQLSDHETAIELVKQAIAGQLTADELKEQLAPLNLALTGGISVGDIEGSFVAIGDGATMIVNKALSAAEEAKARHDLEQTMLAEAVVNLGARLQQAVAKKAKNDRLSNPYKSLLDYRLEDAALFYGRSQAIAQMFERLDRGPLTVLHAESGAGKTSLLQAGLASRLLALGNLPLYIRAWNVNPALAVKRAILPNLADAPGLEKAPLLDFLRRVTAILGETSALYLFLDQFEEFFTQLDESARPDFIAQLADCLEDDSLRVRWVLAMRKEFFGNLAMFRPQIKNPFANDYLLLAMNRTEATEVIIEPAKKQGAAYEPALVERLLNDLSPSADGQAADIAPPHLQLICSTLFDKLLASRQADPAAPLLITAQMYADEGGASGILRGHLNRVLQRTFNPKQREAARQLLTALVSSQQRRVRRSRDDLAATLALYLTAGQNLDQVLEPLLESRLIKVEEDEKTDTTTYELAHDYLLTEIQVDPETQTRKAAQEFLDRELESFRRYRTVLSAQEYDIINSQRQFLVINDEAKELLRQSRLARNRRLLQIAALAVVVIIALSVLAWRAIVRRQEAEHEQKIAQSRQLAADARNLVDTDAELSLLLTLDALKHANLVEAQDTLRQIVPHLRAWSPLNTHSQGVTSVSWSPDSSLAALGLVNGDIQLWDVEDESLLKTLKGHAGQVNRVQFNPRGTHLLSASNGKNGDDALRLWDVSTGQTVGLLKGHTGAVNALAWSPSGDRVLSAGADKVIKLWDMTTLQPIAEFKEHSDEVFGLAWSPQVEKFASGGGNGEVFIWDVASRRLETRFTGHTEDVISVAWNPNGEYLATGGGDSTVRVWDIADESVFDVYAGHTGWVRSVDWHPDGRWLASSAGDTRVIVWDIEAHQPIVALTGHANWVQQVAWSPDGLLASASRDGTARIWDVEHIPGLLVLSGHVGQARSVAWQPGGNLLASGGDDMTVRLWDGDTGAEVDTLEAHTGAIYRVAWSADGSRLASASADNTAMVWSTVTWQPRLTLTGHTASVNWLDWSPDGHTLATASEDQTVQLWDSQSGARRLTLTGHTDSVNALAFSPDGTLLASGSTDKTIILWNPAAGEKVKTLTGHTDIVWDVKFSPIITGEKVSRALASASQDGTVRLWDVSTGQVTATYPHPKAINGLAWSSDGSKLATACDDGLVRLWDVSRRQMIARLSGHQGGVWNVDWRSGQTRLASAATDGVVRIFYTDFNEILALAEQHKHRDLTEDESEEYTGAAEVGSEW